MPKYAYKLVFYSIRNKKDETKLFSSKEECYYTYGLLLGHTFIKDLKAYHYDKLNNKYVQVELWSIQRKGIFVSLYLSQ